MNFKYFLNESGKVALQPKNKVELMKIIKDAIKEQGYNCDLNFIDTSKITDMSYLFYNTKFNGDISQWDVSNVKDMECMFSGSNFNGDVSKWDVSNVEYMDYMFYMSPLEGAEQVWYKD